MKNDYMLWAIAIIVMLFVALVVFQSVIVYCCVFIPLGMLFLKGIIG